MCVLVSRQEQKLAAEKAKVEQLQRSPPRTASQQDLSSMQTRLNIFQDELNKQVQRSSALQKELTTERDARERAQQQLEQAQVREHMMEDVLLLKCSLVEIESSACLVKFYWCRIFLAEDVQRAERSLRGARGRQETTRAGN